MNRNDRKEIGSIGKKQFMTLHQELYFKFITLHQETHFKFITDML